MSSPGEVHPRKWAGSTITVFRDFSVVVVVVVVVDAVVVVVVVVVVEVEVVVAEREFWKAFPPRMRSQIDCAAQNWTEERITAALNSQEVGLDLWTCIFLVFF